MPTTGAHGFVLRIKEPTGTCWAGERAEFWGVGKTGPGMVTRRVSSLTPRTVGALHVCSGAGCHGQGWAAWSQQEAEQVSNVTWLGRGTSGREGSAGGKSW